VDWLVDVIVDLRAYGEGLAWRVLQHQQIEFLSIWNTPSVFRVAHHLLPSVAHPLPFETNA
jgi:hypothetical protein